MIHRALVGLALAATLSLAAGCYAGGGHAFDTATFGHEPGWTSVADVPFIKQKHEADCGAAAAAMLLTYWKHPTESETIWAAAHPAEHHGIAAGWLRDYFKAAGLTTYLLSGTPADLEHELSLGHPVLVGTMVGINDKDYSHYEIVVGVNQKRHMIVTQDPARGSISRDLDDFMKLWHPSEYLMMVVWDKP